MLKKKVNGSWNLLSTVKKNVNGAWADCDCVKKLNNGAWDIVWQRWNAGFSADARTTSTASYCYYAKTTSGGNMLMKLYNQQSNNKGQLDVETYSGRYAAFHVKVGETIFVDYVYTQSGGRCEASIYIVSLDASVNKSFLSGLNWNSSGTVSYTPQSDFYGYLVFTLWNPDVYAPSSNYGQLEISRIYTDSKIFYWNTATLIDI